MNRLMLILLLSTSIASAQDQWTITEFEWHDKKTFERYITPEQWLGKKITFHAKSIAFDFDGIQDYETDIDYEICQLLEQIDTTEVKEYKVDMFAFHIDKFIECGNQYELLETKPNCYRYPFKEFMICNEKGLFELMGVFFLMTKD